jgi:hypothetical protein
MPNQAVSNIPKTISPQTWKMPAVAGMHFGAGLSMRNGWKLWKGKNSLARYFHSIGIFHPDDMSSIILTSFHRRLNGKNIELASQVRYYQDYWNKAKTTRRLSTDDGN